MSAVQRASARSNGFTLLELMISVGLMGLVVAYVFQSFVTQHRTYVVTEQVSEAQQNMRAINDLVERDVRLAGFMVPEHAGACGLDRTNGSDVLVVSDPDAIDPTGQKTSDLGAQLTGGSATGTGTAVLSVAADTLDGAAAYDLDADGNADADFRCDTGSCTAVGTAAGGVIVVDRANPSRGVGCGVIERVAGNSITVDMLVGLGAAGGSANTPDLRVIPAHVYEVDAQSRLLRDNLVLTNDVEDLQVAWYHDLDGDRVEDAGEWSATAATGLSTPSTRDGGTLRAVRVNVVVRTRDEDERLAQGTFQRTENRAAVAGTDGFRRRVLTSTLRLRNVGVRG